MTTNAWNRLGFHLVKARANGKIYNAEYDRDDILTALIQFLPEAGGMKLILMLTMPGLIQPDHVEPFVQKMVYGSRHNRPIHLISHHQMSFPHTKN
jgi:hypothetical protein